MNQAELLNRALVAASAAKRNGFEHTSKAFIDIVQELSKERHAFMGSMPPPVTEIDNKTSH